MKLFFLQVYKPMNTFIALIALEIWTDADKIMVTTPAGDTLVEFTKWRNENLIKRQKHDNAYLITLVWKWPIKLLFFVFLIFIYKTTWFVIVSVISTLMGRQWAWHMLAPCAQTTLPESSRYQKKEIFFIKITGFLRWWPVSNIPVLCHVSQDHNAQTTAVGATLAHEMGHNLGMSHDSTSCTCASDSCIMAAILR